MYTHPVVPLVVLPAVAAAVAGAVTAPPCDAPRADELELDAGTSLAPGPGCGEWLIATDANEGMFSWGRARLGRDLPDAYELRLRWQRLSADGHRPLELHVPGGGVLIRDGSYAFYESDARFTAEGGWRPLPGHDTRQQHELRLVQRGMAIELWVDGASLGSYRFTQRPESGRVRVGLKGERGYRARARFAGPWISAAPPQ